MIGAVTSHKTGQNVGHKRGKHHVTGGDVVSVDLISTAARRFKAAAQ